MQDLIKKKVKKSTTCNNSPVLTGLVEDKLSDTLLVGYDHAKEGVNNPLLNMLGEVIVDTINQGKMDLMLLRSIDNITQSERSNDALAQQVAGCQSLVMPITMHVECYMNKVEEEHCLGQRLKQELLQATYLSPFHRQGGSCDSYSPHANHPKATRVNNVGDCGNFALSATVKGVKKLTLHRQRAIGRGSETISREKRQFWRIQEVAQRRHKQQVNTSREVRH